MNSDSIILMLVAIGLVWGGLLVSILLLRYRNVPEEVVKAAIDNHPPQLGVHPKDLRAVAFDLDDTLAPSKEAISDSMAHALRTLLDTCDVCVISGGQMSQFQTQLLDRLHANPDQLSRLHIMPTCGTRYVRYDGGKANELYCHNLTNEEKQKAMQALEEEAKQLGYWEDETWGQIIEDRGSQITFSALGQEAPLDAKQNWDPKGIKRGKLAAAVGAKLPEMEVRSGGMTSIDITRKGVDKAYGMRALMEHAGYAAPEILFIGDRLDPQGNDYPVVSTGVHFFEVPSWETTVDVINYIVAERAGRA